MKKFILLVLLFILVTMPLKIFAQNQEATPSSSQNFRSADNVTLGKDEVINKDYFATGNTVSLDGTVNGDAYIAGGNIIVTGTINGDLITAGGNLDIRGTVTGNIRAAGGNINLASVIERNATLLGGSINLNSNADIRGSLVSAGGNLNILAPVGKDATLAGGQIVIGNRIGADVNAATDKLNLNSTAAINGNLTYYSRNTASITQGAVISGQTTQNIPKEDSRTQEAAKKGAAAALSFLKIADFILAAIIGILLLKLFPVFSRQTAEVIISKPWVSLGIGFLAVIVFPFLILLLLITIIGIPVAILLAFMLAIYLYLAKIFISFVLGRLILRRFNKNTHEIWEFLLGLVIYFVLGIIPILGWIIAPVAGLIGLGAILIKKKNYYQDLRAKQII